MMTIEFSKDIGPWSPIIFWFVTINAFLTVGFILVVIVGGLMDLRYLLRALREETADPTDDGRVPAGEKPGGVFPVVDAEPPQEPPCRAGST